MRRSAASVLVVAAGVLAVATTALPTAAAPGVAGTPSRASGTTTASVGGAPNLPRLPAAALGSRPSAPLAKGAAHPDRVLVKFRAGASAAARAQALRAVGATGTPEQIGAGYVAVDTSDAAAARRVLDASSAVADVQRDYMRHADAVIPNDPYASGIYTSDFLVRLYDAWGVTTGSATQVIAVLDTGVDVTHPDLVGRTVPGHDFVDGDSVTQDPVGHGTFVSGIIAARANNHAGIAGVNWNARIMPVRVLDARGEGFDSDIAAGVTYAANHGADVINLSLGGPDDDPALHSAIQYAVSKGVVVVAAAGNTGQVAPSYPGAYPEVIGVGAVDKLLNTADFSTAGDWVDLVAPGVDVASTFPGGEYALWSGTSFAAPFVSGIASLVLARNPDLTPAQVANRLERTAADMGAPGKDPYDGYGLVDAYAAVGGPRTLHAGPTSAQANVWPAVAAQPGTTSPLIGVPGGAGWWQVPLGQTSTVSFTVTPTTAGTTGAQKFQPVLDVYDASLHLLRHVAALGAGVQMNATAVAPAGTVYLEVRNALSSAVPAYALDVSQSAGGVPTTPGEQTWVRGSSFSSATRTVTIDFARALDPSTVDATTVRMVDGRFGTAIPSTVSYDGATHGVTVQAATQPAGPTLRVEVDGVTDAVGATAPQLALRYSDPSYVVPPPVTGLTATGGFGFVRLAWTVPDDDEVTAVVVRSAPGTTPPGKGGTQVYKGFGDRLLVTGLVPGQAYTFGVSAIASFQESTAASVVVTGTNIAVVASPSPLTYGGTTTVTATTTDPVTHAPVAGRSVGLYWRRAGTTAWSAIKVGATDANGHLSVLAKPPWNAQLYAVDLGGAGTTGATQTITTLVRFGVTEHLSAATAALGVPVALTGTVSPARAGKPVLLEGYWLGNWHIVASAPLTATGGYRFAVRPATRSTFTFRVLKQYDAALTTGVTPTFTLRVV